MVKLIGKITTAKALALLGNFEAAAREHAWLGSKRPEEQLEIERDYIEAKEKIINVLLELTK